MRACFHTCPHFFVQLLSCKKKNAKIIYRKMKKEVIKWLMKDMKTMNRK